MRTFSGRIYAGELIRLRAAVENINLLNPLIIRLTPTRVPITHSELPGHGYAINPPSINVRIASQRIQPEPGRTRS